MTTTLRSFFAKAGTAYRLGVGMLPDRLALPLRTRDRRFPLAGVPRPVSAPAGSARLYIAPANYAAQGYQWARAAERLQGVGAVNMQLQTPTAFGFPCDYEVPAAVFASSGSWARRQRSAIATSFTHVLFEVPRPIFGIAFQGFVEREANWLQRRDLTVGLVSHGSDLRLPSRHAEIDQWSPFSTADREWVEQLERNAQRNRGLFERLAVASFVATPELLLDWPEARWLPNVVNPADWRNDRPAFSGGVPVVMHAPTNPAVKGTHLIEPTVERLAADGIIDYRRIIKVPSSEMPARYAAADIVLDQFALGIYATTSIEAMAAGRLVLAHLHDQVREHILEVTGREAPIVEATPDTIGDVLRDIAERPDHYREIAQRGPEYVDAVHDGALASRVLAPFLGRSLAP